MVNLTDFNFAYGFRPIYYFSRVFGLMPYTLIYNPNGTIEGHKIKAIDMLWFIISIAINLIMTLMILESTQYLHEIKSTSFILEGGDHLLLLLGAIFNFIIIGMDMGIRFKLMDIFKNINTFDEEVRVEPCHKAFVQTNQSILIQILISGCKNWNPFQQYRRSSPCVAMVYNIEYFIHIFGCSHT